MREEAVRLEKRIRVAAKQEPADLVIRNGKIVNVFTREWMEGDIAIVDGVIAGIGSYEGKESVDAGGRAVIPGLIDGHVHIESSLLTPPEFAKVLLLHGVTTVMVDPHEMANVAGTDGLDYMLDSSDGLPLDVFVMLPSCVPATPFESSGAVLQDEELRAYYSHPRVLGLAEVMDYPSVAAAEPSMLRKLASAQPYLIDGHASGIRGEGLDVYMAAGIRTDHEAVTAEEARDRLARGMYLMIREGTVAKNLKALLPAVTPHTSRRCLLVTDDKLLDDLVEEGSIDHVVRLAVAGGLDPFMAVQMATLNTAEAFRLHTRGAIAPGYDADLVLLDDLEQVAVHSVFKRGVCVVQAGRLQEEQFLSGRVPQASSPALSRLHVKEPSPKELELPLSSDLCHVIEIIPNQIITRHLREQVDIRDGLFMPSVVKDQLKLAVVERHRATGRIGLGIVKGLQLKKGAIASSISHDSHNLVLAGASDTDMLVALRHLTAMNGGLTVVADGEVLASLPLPVGGLMTDIPYMEALRILEQVNEALAHIGAPSSFDPFLTLSFLTLPVIPSLKLTDRGLFDFEQFQHISIEANYINP